MMICLKQPPEQEVAPMSRKLTIEQMEAIAHSRGGQCLSVKYINQKSPLWWECGKGHRWSASADQVKGSKNKKGTWCRECSKARVAEERRQTVEDLQELARSRGGEFLSTESKGSGINHLWSCSNPDHPSFEMRPGSVTQGQWCPKCRGNARPAMPELDELARSMRGNDKARCLSPSYVNSTSPLRWTCGVEGHDDFEKSMRAVKHDRSWCSKCRKKKPTKYNLAMLQEMATKLGGELLSDKYENTHGKLQWRCADGHDFQRSLDSILSYHSFCPTCSRTWRQKESYIRELFSHLLGVRFIAQYPSWLKQGDDGPLELDGYSEVREVAFEYQGEQHYMVDGYFTRDDAALAERQRLDDLKKEICRARGVTLIEIPFEVSWDELQDYVSKRLEERGIEIVDSSRLAPGVRSHSEIEVLTTLAEQRGGELLSTRYKGSNEKLTWKCANPDHPPFESIPSLIKRGSWCDACADVEASARYRVSIDQIQRWAERENGRLLTDRLSTDAQDQGLTLGQSADFQCGRCNRETHRTVKQVRDNSLCLCRTNKARIDRPTIEKALEGLSVRVVEPDEINGGKTRVMLQCEECGHQWSKKAASIVNGARRHSCGRAVTFEKARAAGERAGFRLLTSEVSSGSDLLEWECIAEGHKLTLNYRTMRNRRACQECDRLATRNRTVGIGI